MQALDDGVREASTSSAISAARPARKSLIASEARGWHVVLHRDAADIAPLSGMIRAPPVPFVIDRIGRVDEWGLVATIDALARAKEAGIDPASRCRWSTGNPVGSPHLVSGSKGYILPVFKLVGEQSIQGFSGSHAAVREPVHLLDSPRQAVSKQKLSVLVTLTGPRLPVEKTVTVFSDLKELRSERQSLCSKRVVRDTAKQSFEVCPDCPGRLLLGFDGVDVSRIKTFASPDHIPLKTRERYNSQPDCMEIVWFLRNPQAIV